MQNKKAKYLVVDTTPFIQNAPLHEVGENVLTISDVVEEIRNKRQLRHLASLTYDLQIKDVFQEHISFVSDFAKKTGDYSSLSSTDIKLIALTYQLELENVGRDHLRKSPIMKRFDINASKIVKPIDPKVNGLSLPVKLSDVKLKNRLENDEVIDHEKKEAASDDEYESAEEEVSDDHFEDVGSDNASDSQELLEEEEGEDHDDYDEEEEEEEEEDDDDDDDDDDDGDDDTNWVTPSNISNLKRTVHGGNYSDKEVIVGCMSTDFAVQNVLMQLGLKVVALDGRIITQLRSYVLRCYACFKLTTNMRKVFCPKCGLKTLKRVSVFLDEKGNKCININFKKPINAKGKRFSLPMPQGGKHAVNPRLVEDARRPHQKPSRLARTKTDALEPDYIAGISPFATRDVYSKSAQLGFNKGKPVFKYWMRRNPNEAKRNPKK
ncbi:RNA-binding protein NOB1-like [Planococcus citri]|uniref:RNA-binding protein NOB1-like n=1 Tax=Planococcus citri TaxID=170843 RepID=UPI0031F79D95